MLSSPLNILLAYLLSGIDVYSTQNNKLMPSWIIKLSYCTSGWEPRSALPEFLDKRSSEILPRQRRWLWVKFDWAMIRVSKLWNVWVEVTLVFSTAQSYLEQKKAAEVKISDWQELPGSFNGVARWIRAFDICYRLPCHKVISPRTGRWDASALPFVAGSRWVSVGHFGGAAWAAHILLRLWAIPSLRMCVVISPAVALLAGAIGKSFTLLCGQSTLLLSSFQEVSEKILRNVTISDVPLVSPSPANFAFLLFLPRVWQKLPVERNK